MEENGRIRAYLLFRFDMKLRKVIQFKIADTYKICKGKDFHKMHGIICRHIIFYVKGMLCIL